MTIKCIFFDNNGVLTTNHAENVDAVMAKAAGVSKKKMHDAVLLHAPLLDKGKIRDIEFSRRVAKTVDSNISPALLSYTRITAYKPKKEVMSFARRLAKKYTVALLSNFGDSFTVANKRWHLETIFDAKHMFVSCQIGMCKPHKNIFQYALKKMHVQPAQTIFIDDNKENVAAARQLGIHAILFTTLPKLKTQLKTYGVR